MWRAIRGFFGRWMRDENGERRPGGWMQTYSGEQVWPLDPRPSEIHLDDVVAGLREPRYRGQTREVYTVLEHSVYVSCMAEKLARERGYDDVVQRQAARLGLMHDASEAYIGDVARPLKYQPVMKGYRDLEKRWEAAIADRFLLKQVNAYKYMVAALLVKECDDRIVLDEVEALMIDPDMWPRNGRYPDLEPLGIEIAAWSETAATIAFCERFMELWPDEAPSAFRPLTIQ